MAALDCGIAMLAEAIVAEDLTDGRLRRVLPHWQATSISVHAVTETRLLLAKTRRFIEFLSERLHQTLRSAGHRCRGR
jgi:DNA-binding transcriptional LysR family regulator